MLTLKDIGITFNAGSPDQNEALKNINLTINQGDFITIVGSNGAGKSTLYNIISGNLFASHGTILLNGKDITKLPEYKRAEFIGRIFQNPLLKFITRSEDLILGLLQQPKSAERM